MLIYWVVSSFLPVLSCLSVKGVMLSHSAMGVFRTRRERPEDSGAPEGSLQCLLSLTIGVMVSMPPGINSYLTMIPIFSPFSVSAQPCFSGFAVSPFRGQDSQPSMLARDFSFVRGL